MFLDFCEVLSSSGISETTPQSYPMFALRPILTLTYIAYFTTSENQVIE